GRAGRQAGEGETGARCEATGVLAGGTLLRGRGSRRSCRAAGCSGRKPLAMQRFLRLRDFDWVLMAMVFLLSALSVLEIYSATINTKFHGFESKQVLWLVGGTAAMLLLSFIDYHVLIDVIHWVYGFCLVSLLVVLVAGQKVLGARRWIRVGGIHFQPSEWVKLILIIAVARYF